MNIDFSTVGIFNIHYFKYDIFLFDFYNNCIYSKDSSGSEVWDEYDSDNNLTHSKNSNGSEWWLEYDSNHKCICSKNSAGLQQWYEYQNNILVHTKISILMNHKL